MNWKIPVIGITITAVGAAVAYAIYFDNKRRNDPEFRKKIEQEKKKVMAKKKETESKKELKKKPAPKAKPKADNILNISIEEIQAMTPESRLNLLQELLQKGEMLAVQGPQFYELSTQYIAKAFRLIPNAGQLMQMIQEAYPPAYYEKLLIRIRDDGKKLIKDYLIKVTPENSKAELVADPTALENPLEAQRIMVDLVVKENVKEGEVLYTEKPVSSYLCSDLKENDYCFHCQKQLNQENKVVSEKHRAYCSDKCLKEGWEEYEKHFVDKVDEDKAPVNLPLDTLLTLKYIAKSQVKKNPTKIANHIETMEYAPDFTSLNLPEIEGCKKAFSVPNFEKSELYSLFEPTTFTILKSLVSGNIIAFNDSSKLRESNESPLKRFINNGELQKIRGVGFYEFSAYLKSSANLTNIKMEFSDSNLITIVAKKDLKKGDKLYLGVPEKIEKNIESQLSEEEQLFQDEMRQEIQDEIKMEIMKDIEREMESLREAEAVKEMIDVVEEEIENDIQEIERQLNE